MAWEQLVVRQSGCMPYGPEWMKVPCVAIGPKSMTINESGRQLIGLTSGDIVNVLIDRESRKVAFKIAKSEEDKSRGWMIGKSKGIAVRISCGEVSKVFPDAVACAYRLHKTGPVVVEASLTPGHQVGIRRLRHPRRPAL